MALPRYVRSISPLVVLLLVSTATNIGLGLKVRDLQTRIAALTNRPRLEIGTPIPALDVQTISGEARRLAFPYEGHPTVVYVFSPQCGWCERNLDNLDTLSAGVARRGYRLVGVSLTRETLADYVTAKKLSFPIFSSPSDANIADYYLGGTPQTILIGADGRVLKVWTGAYAGSIESEIEKEFDLTLPGLRKS